MMTVWLMRWGYVGLSDVIYVAADNEEIDYVNKYVNYDNETYKTLIKIIVENDY
jgi:hypothetical protein